jgi:rare lipoprotein A
MFSLADHSSPSPPARRAKASSFAAVAGVLAMAGCAQAPQHMARHHGKEYFPESVYGHASPRVIADGEPVPKGGGQYLVGNPYTVAGHTYVPSERKYTAVGVASWYGDAFHGRRTSNGEIYDRDALTAAHPTMPLPSYARVTNLRNHRSLIVRVNDRGPFHAGRVMDLSSRAAEALGYKSVGSTKVKVEYVGHASLAGSDDRKLLATLRVDGRPAELGDFAYSPTRIAEQPAFAPSAAPERQEVRQEVHQEVRQEQAALRSEPEAVAPPPVQHAVASRQIEAEPRRVALAETIEDSAPSAPIPKNPPLPPQRPYDLGKVASSGPPTPVRRPDLVARR